MVKFSDYATSAAQASKFCKSNGISIDKILAWAHDNGLVQAPSPYTVDDDAAIKHAFEVLDEHFFVKKSRDQWKNEFAIDAVSLNTRRKFRLD